MNDTRAAIRVDLQLIADIVPAGSRVLDVGCGEGALLRYLSDFKQVDAPRYRTQHGRRQRRR